MGRYVKYVVLWVLIFAVMGGLSAWVTNYREEQCAKTCIAAGKHRYQYHGFSGGLRSLRGDICTCLP
jgi:hypothetical protein